MSTQPHTDFRKGQTVIIHLRNGGKFIGKYNSKFSNGVSVEDTRFSTREIRQINIYKRGLKGGVDV